MMSKDLLLAAGTDKLTIININSHSIIRIIEVYGPRTQFDPSENSINALCLLTENIILSVDTHPLFKGIILISSALI